MQAMTNPSAFDNLLKRYNVSYALVETYVPIDYSRLLPAPKWRLVYFDDYAQVLVKRGTGNDALIKQYGYTVFNPYTFLYTFARLRSSNAYFNQPGLLSDLHRLVTEVPYSAMANLAYGLALIYNNADYTDGLRYIDTAKRIMPYNPRILIWYGIEHGLNGDTRLMQKSFHTAGTVLRYQKGETDQDQAYLDFIMGYYYYVAGLDTQAKKSLTIAVKLNPNLSEAHILLNRMK